MNTILNHSKWFFFFILGLPCLLTAQVAINENGVDPDGSAMLDISSANKGLLMPRVTPYARTSMTNPANGLVLYDLLTESFWYYGDGSWRELMHKSHLVSIKESPQLVSELTIGPYPRDIEAANGFAYVVDEEADDLKIIDISNPKDMKIVSSLSVGNHPFRIGIQDNYAYIIDHASKKLKIVDISDENAPFVVSALALPSGDGEADLEVDGDYVYMVNYYTDMMSIVDVSDKSNPAFRGTAPTGNWPRSIEKKGNYVYVVDNGSSDLKSYDVSDPYAPFMASSISAGKTFNLDIKGDYVYLTDENSNKLKIYDISDPTNLSLLSSVATQLNDPNDVEVLGDYAYTICYSSDKMSKIDISDPTNPVFINAMDLAYGPVKFCVDGHYAYVVDNSSYEIKSVWIGDVNTQPVVSFDTEGNLVSSLDMDNQTLSLSGTSLSISNGNTLDLSGIMGDSDDQTLSLSGTNLSIADGNTVDLSSIDTDTDDQTLSLSGTSLSIADGNTVDLSSIDTDTDDQTLTFSGTNLSIADGNTVNLSDLKDNFGNHIATQNIRTNGNWLSSNGTNKGIYVLSTGSVGINDNSPAQRLEVGGNAQLSNNNPKLVFFEGTGSEDRKSEIRTTMNGNITIPENTAADHMMSFHISNDTPTGTRKVMSMHGDGTVGVGIDSAEAPIHVRGSRNEFEKFILRVDNTANNNSDRNEGILVTAGHNVHNPSKESSFIQFETPGGTYCGRVRQSGGNSVQYVSPSDIRLKENIRPTQYGLSDLMNIEVRDYNYKTDEADNVQTGFIAQQLYTAYPPAVGVGGENPLTDPWEVSYGELTPILVQSIQEQQKIIEQLEARIKTLEAIEARLHALESDQ